MKRAIQIIVTAMLLLAVGGLARRTVQIDRPVQIVDLQNSNAPARFAWVDAWIDPHGQPLAAYQFELKSSGGGVVTLVGVEGGEHPAFTPPPYYDAKANVQKRIIIAGFNTGDDLPHARTRVARVMVQIKGNPTWSATLQVAASSEAKPIEADVSVSEGAAQ
jgi:hypothetical protein